MITTSVIKQLIKEKKYVPELLINNKYNKKHNKKHTNIKTEEILGLCFWDSGLLENTILWLGDDTNSNIICYISLRIKIRTWIFQRQTNPLQDILSVLALPCFCTYLQKVWSKKTNKKHFKTLEKEKYVTPDQIFEAAWTAIWTVDDLAPPTYLTFKDVDIQMFHDNTCPLFFVIILLNHSVQCCCNAETSPLINTVKYCTGCYIIATLG